LRFPELGRVRGVIDYVCESRENNFDEEACPRPEVSRGSSLIFSIGILVIWRRVADRRTSDL